MGQNNALAPILGVGKGPTRQSNIGARLVSLKKTRPILEATIVLINSM